eukprot:m.6771 g.6771  ORF g.6771 m.6771 type:complete len:820 (+) comp16857_c0_seq1:886-3345(+)
MDILSLLLVVSAGVLGVLSSDDYVFVLDTTAKMSGDRVTAIRQAIMSFVLDGTGDMRVGVVGFAKKAKRYSRLISLTSPKNKQRVLASLPTEADLSLTNGASFGAGISKAVRTLGITKGQKGQKCYVGGVRVVIVITASGETESPSLRNRRVVNRIACVNAVIHSVVIGAQASDDCGLDDLLSLTKNSNGMVFFESETPGEPYTVSEALLAITQKTDDKFLLQLLNMGMFTLSPGDNLTVPVHVDKSVGDDTVFYISWIGDCKCNNVCFLLVDPNNTTLNMSSDSFAYSERFCMAQYNIKGRAINGTWTMIVTNNCSDYNISVTSAVYSRAVGDCPLLMTADIRMVPLMNSAYAEISARITKCNLPVINAKVVATITRPNQEPALSNLTDTGIPQIDGRKNDGLYGMSFTDFTGDGMYHVRVTATVKGNGDMPYYTVTKTMSLTSEDEEDDSMPAGREGENGKEVTTMLDSFTRMGTPGMFSATMKMRKEMPPCQVTDLRLVETSIKCSIVTLTWTAPGGRAYNGKAAEYEVRMGDHEQLRNRFNTTYVIPPSAVLPRSMTRLDSPKIAGETEELTFKCDACLDLLTGFGKKVFSFTIRAVNDAGIWSLPATPFPTGGYPPNVSDVNCPTATPTLAATEASTESGKTREMLPPSIASEIISLATTKPRSIPATPWWQQFLPQKNRKGSAGSIASVFLPNSCTCDVDNIKRPVCDQDLTFYGLVKSSSKTDEGYEDAKFQNVIIYSKDFPNGTAIEDDVRIIHRCTNCKSFTRNFWYVFTANLSPVDEEFYTDGKSMVRRLKDNNVEKTLSRIRNAFSKC